MTSSHGLVLWAGGALQGGQEGAQGSQGGVEGGQGGAQGGALQGGQDFLMLGIQDGVVQVIAPSFYLLFTDSALWAGSVIHRDPVLITL